MARLDLAARHAAIIDATAARDLARYHVDREMRALRSDVAEHLDDQYEPDFANLRRALLQLRATWITLVRVRKSQ